MQSRCGLLKADSGGPRALQAGDSSQHGRNCERASRSRHCQNPQSFSRDQRVGDKRGAEELLAGRRKLSP